MSSRVTYFLEKTLGEDFMESLAKTELWKPGTKSVNDIDDMRIGLKIVPRTIMSFLIRELAPMNIGENKEVKIPVPGNAVLKATKHERDQYSGEVVEDHKILVDFKFRSIPGLGLVIMSAFELYDSQELHKESPVAQDIEQKVQKLIDERLALHDLVEKVVEKKLAHQQATHNFFLMKLTEELEAEKKKHKQIADLRHLAEHSAPQSEPYFRGMTNGIEVANAVVHKKEPNFVEAPKKKGSPVKDFLESRKLKKGEYSVHMAKSEKVDCPDCGKNIFNGQVFSGCVCLGDDMERKVFIKKSEDGIKVRFSKGWDEENIEMLLEVLRRKHE